MAGLQSLGEAIGDALGGGQEKRIAEAQVAGQYRSAQTEQALANARKTQAESLKAQRENDARARVEKAAIDFGAPSNANLADLMLGGMGSDFSAVQAGANKGQERSFRDEIAQPGTTYERGNQLRMAAGDAAFNAIDAVGTHGAYSDARHPELGVQKPLGEAMFAEEPTTAVKNYEYSQHLPKEQRGGFSPFVRGDTVLNAGGVPTVRNATTGDVTTPVSKDDVAANAAAIAQGKATGTGMAKRTLDYPAAKSRVANSVQKVRSLAQVASDLQANEALWQAVGLGKPIASIASTEGAKLRGLINTLKSKVGFAVLQDMRESSKTGGALGNISNQENEYLQNSLAALDANMAPEDFREQLQVLIGYAAGSEGRINQAFMDTYPEGAPKPAGAPAAAPVPGGAPAGKPKTVKQGGFTYTLNEATGEYE